MAITTNNLISRQTVGSAGAASVTFSNIPQTFTDLRIVVSGRGTAASNHYPGLELSFNGSSTTYTDRVLQGTGGVTVSYSNLGSSKIYLGTMPGGAATASVFGNIEITVPNYTSSNYKSVSIDEVQEDNQTTAFAMLIAGLWSTVNAITSIAFTPTTGNFDQYSTFSLYGISSNTSTQNTSVPSATGGDVITTDGTYWYHAFKYSGTFTPLKALTADYLVVAGAGGGGAGGGGAGGLRSTVTATGGGGSLETALSLTTTGYTVTVGAGGVGTTADSVKGTNGTDSVFSTITSTGGGGGGNLTGATTGSNGGSGGGGGAWAAGGPFAGGTGTTNQGRAGGIGRSNGINFGPGGGGGANTAGTDGFGSGSNENGGGGGAGVATSITGTSVTYGGGGGGGSQTTLGSPGAGGSGGGGAGGVNTTKGTAGTANTGGGGGGIGQSASYPNTGNGGSGIVVVRYVV